MGQVEELGESRDPRRRVLALLSGAAGALLAAVGGVPLLASLLAPIRRAPPRDGGFVRVARLAGLPEGRPVRVAVVAERRDVWWREPAVALGAAWLVRRGAEVLAFSAACPHLGCGVDADPAGGFRCPCHGSAFDAGGAVRGGPSPRGLDRLEVRVAAGTDPEVELRWQRFRAGTAGRRAV